MNKLICCISRSSWIDIHISIYNSILSEVTIQVESYNLLVVYVIHILFSLANLLILNNHSCAVIRDTVMPERYAKCNVIQFADHPIHMKCTNVM